MNKHIKNEKQWLKKYTHAKRDFGDSWRSEGKENILQDFPRSETDV